MASARLRRRCNEASSRMPQDFGADRLLEARARRPKYDSGEKALLREDWAATPESYFGLGQTSAGIWPEFGWQTLSNVWTVVAGVGLDEDYRGSDGVVR